jgi:hypothetical protein
VKKNNTSRFAPAVYIFVEISKKSCGIFDFYKAEELVATGRYATQKKLDSLKN